MDEGAPIQPRQFRFDEQDPDDFEEMCHQLVRNEFPEAVRTDAPDDGADTLLPGPTRDEYLRAWQARRYTGHIKFSECEKALDRAVETTRSSATRSVSRAI